MRVLLLIFLLSAWALSISDLSIKAEVDQTGKARVTEVYSLDFVSDAEYQAFLKRYEELGSFPELWKGYLKGFDLHVGREPREIKIVAQPEEKKVILSYTSVGARKKEESFRMERWVVDYFRFPVESGAYTIPDYVKMEIKVPEEARIVEVVPPARISDNTVYWKGPMTTNTLYVEYESVKPITLRVPEIPQETYVVLVSVFGFLFLLALIFRGRIRKKISEYVDSHTEFVSEEPFEF